MSFLKKIKAFSFPCENLSICPLPHGKCFTNSRGLAPTPSPSFNINTQVAPPLVTRSFLLLVAMPGAPGSVLAPSSDARVPSSFSLYNLLCFLHPLFAQTNLRAHLKHLKVTPQEPRERTSGASEDAKGKDGSKAGSKPKSRCHALKQQTERTAS